MKKKNRYHLWKKRLWRKGESDMKTEELRNEQGLTEKEFLAAYRPGDYERPSVTVDMMIFTRKQVNEKKEERDPGLKLLLIQRKNHPCIYQWAIPGGFVEMTESLEEAAARELKEETGLEGIAMTQVHTFGNPKRDPRTRIISCAYMAVVEEGSLMPKAGDDARQAVWFQLSVKNTEHPGSWSFVLENKEQEIQMKYLVEECISADVLDYQNTKIVLAPDSTDALAFDHPEFVYRALKQMQLWERKTEKTDLIKGIQERRSIRKFKNLPVPRESMEEIVAAASFAPSWKNTQTARYIVIEKKELIQTIASKDYMAGFTYNVNTVAGAQALVVLATVKGRSGYERDGSFSTPKKDKWEVFDAGIAAQTFCLAAHEKGVGTVIMGIFDEQKIAELIGLPQGQEIAALIAVGYPDINPEAPKRKPVSELVTFL